MFQQQLQAVSKVINAKNTMQILDNFLLRVTGDTLEITGSDSENMVKAVLGLWRFKSGKWIRDVTVPDLREAARQG